MEFSGRIVIGEGERDEAPMLYIGEELGKGGEEIDIAVDPLEGTNLCAANTANALCTIAVAPRGALLFAPDTYMRKIAAGPECRDAIHIDKTPAENVAAVAEALGKPVSELIGPAFVNTLWLALAAALVAWVVGIACGLFAAIRKGTIVDRLFMGFSLLGVSLPVFMVAMLLQYVFARYLHWLPVAGISDWTGYILPAIALGWGSAGSIARLVRSSIIEVLQQDYIDTARAKGRTNSQVLVFHALRNAMLPVITLMAMQFSGLLSGAVITETVFSINGIGRLSVQAIAGRDIPLLQGTTLLCTFVIVMGNLAADLLYNVCDPRVRKGA
jgi:peptide/nickel transport system permease protein